MLSARTRDLVACIALCGLIAAFFWQPLFCARQFFSSDTHALFYPLKALMTGELLAGRLPLWDPHSLCGYPIVGSYISAVFLPQNVLYVALPFPLAFKCSIILKHLLAGVFQYLLLRRLRLEPGAAFAGALAFALSGPLLSITSLQNFAFECLPLTVWLWWRVADRRDENRFASAGAWCAAALGFAFVFLHGDLQTVYTGGLLALFLPLAASPCSFRRFGTRALALATLSLLVAGLVAVQLFPAVSVLEASDRLALADDERLRHSLSFGGLGELLWPFGLRESASSTDFIACKYMGMTTFVLALAGLGSSIGRRSPRPSPYRRPAVFFGVTAVIALLLALGENFPLLEPLCSVLPGLSLFRYPQKWLELFVFAICVVASIGVAEILTVVISSGKRAAQRRGLAVATAVAAVIAVDLASTSGRFLGGRLVDDSTYDARSILEPAVHAPRLTPHDRILRVPTNGPFDSFDAEGDDHNRVLRSRLISWNLQTLLGNAASHSNLRRVSGISSFRYRRVEDIWRQAATTGQLARAADLFAARLILSTESTLTSRREASSNRGVVPEPPNTVVWDATFGRITLGERPTALPRAHVVSASDVAFVADSDEALRVLFSADFDVHRSAVIETEGPDTRTPSSSPSDRDPDDPPVRFLEDGTTVVRLRVENVGPEGGYLILNDTYDAGWNVRVDGDETELFRANVYARGVRLPAGDCEVEFVYRPASLRWGMGVSLAALVGLLVLRGWIAVRRKRDTQTSVCP